MVMPLTKSERAAPRFSAGTSLAAATLATPKKTPCVAGRDETRAEQQAVVRGEGTEHLADGEDHHQHDDRGLGGKREMKVASIGPMTATPAA